MRARRPIGSVVAVSAAAGLLSIAVASPATAAIPGPDRHVVNGSAVVRPGRNVPWAVSLYHSEDGRSLPDFHCSGTAVSPTEILTAAHCVDTSEFFYVRVGGDAIDRGRLIAIEAVNVNSAYRPLVGPSHDIAVLRTVEPMGLAGYARLGSPAMAAAFRSGMSPKVTLYGWGLDEHENLSGQLRSTVLFPQTSAARAAFGSDFKSDRMIAAGRYNTATRRYSGGCNGDSGGPLVAYRGRVPYVVGVTSFGSDGCLNGTPTVFTSVGNYDGWLVGARRALPVLAQRANRALPAIKSRVSISGTIAVGSTLTCSKGTWTSNSGGFTYRWFRDEYTLVGSTATYRVSKEDAGLPITCAVTATSRAGRFTAFADVQAGRAPQASGSVAITGLEASGSLVPPALGTVATCTAPTFSPAGAALTQAWYVERPDGTRSQLATEPALVLAEDVQRALAGNELVCEVVATNAMGDATARARRGFPALYPPTVFAYVASVPVVAGTTATCTPTADEGTTVTYQWAIEPSPTYGPAFSAGAQLLGTGPTYTLTDSDVAAIGGGSKLACQVTASAWYGVASYVRPMA